MALQKLNNRARFASCFLIVAFCFLFLFSFTSCGRRGDPVPIAPYNGDIVTDAGKDQEPPQIEEETVDREGVALMPDAPTGLMALYTQKAVVLTWDEVMGQDVKRYKVYRSSGDGYMFIGDTAAPAFTDRKIKRDTKYYYKVTSVGVLESSPSKKIEVVTEAHR